MDNYKTKKEIIIDSAYQDPFLKIEDLANKANTTSRYVRTILSESNLSLMELRKNYARKIEDNKYNMNDRLVLNNLLNRFFQSSLNILEIDELIINSPADINDIVNLVEKVFIYKTFQLMLKNDPMGISTVFINKKYLEIKDHDNLELITKSLCGLLSNNDYNLSSLDIVVDVSTGQVSNFLGLSKLCPVLRLKQTITKKQEIIASILLYFDSRQIGFSLSHNSGLSINKKKFIE